MDDKDQAAICAAENSEVPDEGNDDPSRKICQRDADVPRAELAGISALKQDPSEQTDIHYPC